MFVLQNNSRHVSCQLRFMYFLDQRLKDGMRPINSSIQIQATREWLPFQQTTEQGLAANSQQRSWPGRLRSFVSKISTLIPRHGSDREDVTPSHQPCRTFSPALCERYTTLNNNATTTFHGRLFSFIASSFSWCSSHLLFCSPLCLTISSCKS